MYDKYFTKEEYEQFFGKKRILKKRNFKFTSILLILCIGFFLASFFLEYYFGDNFYDYFLFNSDNVFKYPWILVTNSFFHASFEHLFVNCWGLLMFGFFLERIKGKNFIMKLFFSSVIISNIVFGLFNPGIYGLGISGYLYAIIGSVVVVSPNTKIFIMPFPIPLSIKLVGPIFLIIEIVLALIGGDGVGHIAHAVGFVVGFLLSKYYKSKEVKLYHG